MRSSVTSDSELPHPPLPTHHPDRPQDPPGSGCAAPAAPSQAGVAMRFEVAGEDTVTADAVRVRLVDVTRGRRLAADDEGRHVSDDPLAWLEGAWGPGTTA